MKAEEYIARFLNKKLSNGDKESEQLAKKIAKSQSVRAITEGPEISMARRATNVERKTIKRARAMVA